jgi:acyl-CoA thioesterase
MTTADPIPSVTYDSHTNIEHTNIELAGRVAAAMWRNDHASREAGLALVSVQTGNAVVSMTVAAQHVNGLGVCHGGYIFLLADTAMAFASNSHNEVALAVAAQIDFVRAAREGETLIAVASQRVNAKRTGILDVEVKTTEGDLVALFHGRTAKTGGSIV